MLDTDSSGAGASRLPSFRRRSSRNGWVVPTVAVLVLLGGLAGCTSSSPGGPAARDFGPLAADRRVYDETASSLTEAETEDLEQRLEDLRASVGADVVLYVRALDATPEQTLDQVEALQQAWVAQAGADEDSAVALLINRNPDDPGDARAGVFVGRTFDDGNVPRDEQVAIVDDEMIPPLRDSDVHASFVSALTRFERSARNGPPTNAFEDFAADAGRTWFPWAGLVVAMAGAAAFLVTFRRRETTDAPAQEPTTRRPGDLAPGLAAALATGKPQASIFPATVLALAERDALVIEPESEGGHFTEPKIRVRLLDRNLVDDDIEREVWSELEQRADDGVVTSKDLQKAAQKTKGALAAINHQMRDRGWLDHDVRRRRLIYGVIMVLALVGAVFGVVLAAAGETLWPLVAVAAFVLVAGGSLACSLADRGLSRRGQEAAIPWRAYRKGLDEALKDDKVVLDLDAVLVDAVAMNLGSAIGDRVEEAYDSGRALRAFTSDQTAAGSMVAFPWWAAFNAGAFSSSGGGSGATVSGGGAGGGGGAAGST